MKSKNIVLIVADTLRAKNLPSYGGKVETTEFLRERTSIQNYYSNSPWTVPAHATIFSGEHPSDHGSTTRNTYFDSENSLVKKFKKEGYTTFGLSENGLVRSQLGFDKGFDHFGNPHNYYAGANSWNETWRRDSDYSNRKEKLVDFTKLLLKNTDKTSVKALLDYELADFKEEDFNPSKSEYTIERATHFLKNNEKTFLFLNLMPVHASYTFNREQKEEFLPEIPEDEIEKFTNFDTLTEYLSEENEIEDLFNKREKAYNASISYLDTLLEKMYKKAPDSTIFVLVGDHGELIGEYEKEGSRLVNHHFGTFKELVEVPLYIYTKGEDIELEKNGNVFDHISLHNFLKNLSEGQTIIEGNDIVRSEYFGKSGFNKLKKQTDIKTPEKYRKLFERKSFSIIDTESKVDFASDGKFFWDANDRTEKQQVPQGQVNSKLIEKGEILYQWRLEE